MDNYYGIVSIDGSHHTFSNNIIKQCYSLGIVTWDDGNNNIFGNTASENAAGIFLSWSKYNTVSQNIIVSNRGMGMHLSGSQNTITNNAFFNNGVYVEDITNYFSGNTVNDKPLIYLDRVANKSIDEPAGQIILMHCNNITIQEQKINNTLIGILLCCSENCLIESCTLSNNSHSGLLIKGLSNSNSILNNTIEKNLYRGIVLEEFNKSTPEYNIIARNDIIGHGEVGLILCYTTYNVIYHNNFINNKRYASYYSDGQKNKWWYNPTVQEGNYWDDYEEKYPDAKPRTDRPYIWDTPYNIAGNNEDNYPLIEPYDEFDPNAPTASDIDGPTNGKIEILYDYTFVATDPNDDDVFYYITWGDSTFEEWIGPFGSGEEVILSHTWTGKSSYCITAQAKDTNGLIGPWGTLMVTMSRSRATTNSLILRFLEQFPLMREVLSRLIPK